MSNERLAQKIRRTFLTCITSRKFVLVRENSGRNLLPFDHKFYEATESTQKPGNFNSVRTLFHCSLDVLMFIILLFWCCVSLEWSNNGSQVWADLVFHCTKVSSAPIHAIKFSEVINRRFLRIFFCWRSPGTMANVRVAHEHCVSSAVCALHFCFVLTTFMTFFCSFMVFCIRVFMLCKAFIWPLEWMRTHVGPNEH